MRCRAPHVLASPAQHTAEAQRQHLARARSPKDDDGRCWPTWEWLVPMCTEVDDFGIEPGHSGAASTLAEEASDLAHASGIMPCAVQPRPPPRTRKRSPRWRMNSVAPAETCPPRRRKSKVAKTDVLQSLDGCSCLAAASPRSLSHTGRISSKGGLLGRCNACVSGL